MSKLPQKNLAIQLRKKGLSYSEILKDIPVAKATLSVWFKEVGLSAPQKQRLTHKRIAAALRGSLSRKRYRIELTEQIKNEAIKEVGKLNKKFFWLIGAALYWAEGAKQKEHNVAARTVFSNSDPLMIKFFYQWLIDICGIKRDKMYLEIYLHSGCDVTSIKAFWSRFLKINVENLNKIRYKPNKFKNYRKNTGEDYHGVVRIVVRRSTNLNRKIMGWVDGVYKQFVDN